MHGIIHKATEKPQALRASQASWRTRTPRHPRRSTGAQCIAAVAQPRQSSDDVRRITQRWPRWGVTLAAVCLLAGGAVDTARADCHGTQPYVVCENVKVTELIIYVDSPAYVKVNGNMDALPCTLSGGYILLRSHEANFRLVYATLLAAQLQSRDVDIRLSPTDPVCSVAYVIIR